MAELAALKVAVTPLGTPDAVRFTTLLKLFNWVMATVLPALLPPTRSVSDEGVAETVKLGAGIVNDRDVLAVAAPELPAMVTG